MPPSALAWHGWNLSGLQMVGGAIQWRVGMTLLPSGLAPNPTAASWCVAQQQQPFCSKLQLAIANTCTASGGSLG